MLKDLTIKKRNLPDVIAESLREAILNGEMQGGHRLRQEEIAALFGTSLIPVREGLRRLEAQGLVTFKTNKGAFVTELFASEVEELFEIRILLEVGAIKKAAPLLSKAAIREAGSILDQMDRETNGRRLSLLNWRFHSMLYSASGRERLIDLIGTFHVNVERYMRMYLLDMQYHPTSQTEHRAILKACGERDADAAGRLLEAHMEAASRHLVAFLEKRGGKETTHAE